jgi:hypothetical protein
LVHLVNTKPNHMKQSLLLLGIILMSSLQAISQYQRCGADEYQQSLEDANPALRQMREQSEPALTALIQNNPNYRVGAVVTIPVVFHIIYNTTAQNISDNRIFEQLNVLNQDYARTNADAANTRSQFLPVAANTEIQFCLAQRTPQGTPTNGIVRVQTANTTLPNNPHTISPEWDRTKYLNVYVGNLGGGLLGYANLPPGTAGNDHVVVLFSSVGGPNFPGTANPYHLGRTLTHEVGHWLNLQHTFNGGCGGTTASNCLNAGDFVCDTPPVSSNAFGCPTNNPNTCTETSPFPPPYTADMVNMYENYMDYTDDGCMNIFTSGQGSRMNAAITQYRSGLITSNGCLPVGLNEILDGSFVTVSPNPAKGKFDVQFVVPVNDAVEIMVYDMKGMMIFKGIYDETMNRTVQLDLTANPAGVYQMMVQTKKGYAVKRLMLAY